MKTLTSITPHKYGTTNYLEKLSIVSPEFRVVSPEFRVPGISEFPQWDYTNVIIQDYKAKCL